MLTAVRYAVRRMVPGDILQVVDIERESFPSTWPQSTYKRELQNRLAHYLVLVQQVPEHPPERPLASPAPVRRPLGWRRTMRRLFSLQPPPEPTQELILGFVGLWLMVGEAHIVTLAVRESQRRQGLGEVLLIAAIEGAVAHGQEAITLEVRRSNEAAVSLYEKYGFTRVGVRISVLRQPRRRLDHDHASPELRGLPGALPVPQGGAPPALGRRLQPPPESLRL